MQNQFAARTVCNIETIVFCITISTVGILHSAQVQENDIEAKSFRDRVCDFVILSDGTRLTGIAINEAPVRLVVRPVRLKDEAEKLFANEIEPAIADRHGKQNEELRSTLQQRINQIKIDAPDDLQQIGLLEEIIERLDPEDNRMPPWVIVEIEANRLKRLETLAPNRRELATFALLNQIDDFENLHWKTISARLQTIPVAQLKRPTTPTQQTPPELMAQRILAAVDVRLNKATRLIRTGNTFISEDEKPDMAALMSSLLGSSLSSTLQELLSETGGAVPKPAANDQGPATLRDAAIRIAEKNGHVTVAVSSFDFDLTRGTAAVTRQLFRSSKPRDWKLIESVTGSATTNDVTDEQVRKIEDDPQIQQISELLSQLSSDANSLQTAVKMGAVVQSALAKTDAAFQSAIQDLITARTMSDETPITIVLKSH